MTLIVGQDAGPDLAAQPNSKKRRFMSEDDQKIEYVNAVKKAQKLGDLLASLTLKLKNIGSRSIELGKTLEGSGSRSLDQLAGTFSPDTFGKNCVDIPDLVEQYKIAHTELREPESILSKFGQENFKMTCCWF